MICLTKKSMIKNLMFIAFFLGILISGQANVKAASISFNGYSYVYKFSGDYEKNNLTYYKTDKDVTQTIQIYGDPILGVIQSGESILPRFYYVDDKLTGYTDDVSSQVGSNNGKWLNVIRISNIPDGQHVIKVKLGQSEDYIKINKISDEVFPKETNIPINKVWKIGFKQPISTNFNDSTISSVVHVVEFGSGISNTFPVIGTVASISADRKSVTIKAPEYEKGKYYAIVVEPTLLGKNAKGEDQYLKHRVIKEFCTSQTGTTTIVKSSLFKIQGIEKQPNADFLVSWN